MLRTSLVVWVLAQALFAQVPEGWVLVARHRATASLAVAPPISAAVPTPITGLPVGLRDSGVSQGCSAAAILGDGRIVAANHAASSGDPVDLFVLTLSGLQVVGVQQIAIGQATQAAGTITAIDPVANSGGVAIAVFGVQSALLNGSTVALVDLATGSVLPVAGSTRDWNAMVFQPATAEFFLGEWMSNGGAIFRMSIAGGTPTLVTATPDGITNMDIDNDGSLVVAMNNARDCVGIYDFASGTFSTIPSSGSHADAVTVERATGQILYHRSAGLWQLNRWDGAARTSLGTLGNGIASAADVQDSPRTYGVGSGGSSTHRWLVAPNAGGVPTLGNASFSLTLESLPTPPAIAVFVVGTSRAQARIAGLDVLVGGTLTTWPVPVATTAVIQLPVPNNPALAGAVFHGQMLGIESGGALAASPGVTFGIVTP